MKTTQSKNTLVFKDYDIVRYPIMTEKSNQLTAHGQYFFVVQKEATKKDVKEAVERIFDVKVKSVNTAIRKGKLKAFKGHQALLSDVKRAMVCLQEGYSITLVSGV